MKGRIFTTIIGIAAMLFSVSAKAQITANDLFDLDVKKQKIHIQASMDDDGTTKKTDEKVTEIYCAHQHGLAQIAEAGYPIVAAFLATSVYKKQIEADKEVDMAKWVGTTDANGNHSMGYFDVLGMQINAVASNPWLAMSGGGYGMYGNAGMYGNSARGY